MRRRSAMRRRRDTREVGATRRHVTVFIRRIVAMLGRWAPSRRVRRILPALAVLLGIGLLFGVRPVAVSAVPSQLPASVAGPPIVARWVDSRGDPKLNIRATAYTLWMGESQQQKPGSFIFSVTGVTGESIQQVQVSGSAALQPSEQGTLTQNTCDVGKAAIDTTPTVTGVKLSTHSIQTIEPVVFQLRTRVDQRGLVAYALLTVLGVNTNDTTLCTTGTGTVFQMVSGCDPVSDTCTDAVNDPTTGIVPSVNSYADAVRAGDWGKVYSMTSQLVTSQYTASEFADLIQSQYGGAGRITSVSHIDRPADVKFDAGGQAYFKVSQTVSYDKNGQSSTIAVTSYYLFEDGAWKFWFSCDPNAKC